MTRSARIRATVSAADLVIQPSLEQVDQFGRPRLGELVARLSPKAQDRIAGRRRFEVVVEGWRFEVTTESAERAELKDRALRAAAEHQVKVDIVMRAQIPGKVARLWVAEGESVEEGQRLLAIEAMKMENEIRAPHAGTVRSIRVGPGAKVEREDELLTVVQ